MKIKGIIGALFLFCLFLANSVFAAEGKIPIDDARNCSGGTGAITQSGSYFLSNDIGNTENASGCLANNAIIIQADHVTIDLMGHSINVTGAYDGIYANGYTDIEIRNGKIVTSPGNGNNGIEFLQSGGEFRIVDMTILGYPGDGITITGTAACTSDAQRARVVIVNDTIAGPAGGGTRGIRLDCAQSSRIEQNQVRSETDGLVLVGTVDSTVTNNISNQNNSGGIVLDQCNNLQVTDNVVTKNGNVGLLLKNTNNSIVSRNDSSFNTGHGIHLDGTGGATKNNMITHNNASNNGVVGMCNNGILVDTNAADNALDWNVTNSNCNCGISFTLGVSVTANVFSYNRSKGNGGPGPLPAPGYCDPNGAQNTNVVKTPAVGGACPGVPPGCLANATSTNE